MTTTRETVDAFFAAFGSGNLEGVVSLFADTVDFNVPGAPNVPWTGARCTKSEVTDFFTLLIRGGLTEPEEFVVDATIVDGDEAVVAGYSRFRVVATGKSFDNPFAIHFTVRDGQLVRYHMHEDSYAISQAFMA
ncbi:SnoaL-like domain-containing protein [Leucobacter coleopterorum]|uniref:SnoaL-like domain-containing protein n=1 Tax=Leucobacter coleopterorum TaxID=2714933 RepID=A0ABX6JTI7_9MICO|nr:nuclear transport factor 2 family protein [Leucobacter coleopterorum]QIM17601.1 SnoaL-like domain-containing protein [Leucobacter coleopterorum]